MTRVSGNRILIGRIHALTLGVSKKPPDQLLSDQEKQAVAAGVEKLFQLAAELNLFPFKFVEVEGYRQFSPMLNENAQRLYRWAEREVGEPYAEAVIAKIIEEAPTRGYAVRPSDWQERPVNVDGRMTTRNVRIVEVSRPTA